VNDPQLTITLPAEVVEAIAQRAAAIVLAQHDNVEANGTPWLSGARAAADYLGWPRERIYKRVAAGELPHYREGDRLMFRRDELDRWLADHRERP
jgi:excisionase family DNA binding protein